MKITRTPTYIIALVSAVTCAASCGAVWAMLYLVSTQAAALDASLHEQAMHTAERTQMVSFTKIFEATATDRAALKTFVLDDSGIIGFLSRLEHTAEVRGLLITTESVTTEPITDSLHFETLSLRIRLTGSKDAIMQYIAYLERLPYQVQIPSVTMERGVGVDSGWTASLQVRITKTLPHG